MVAAAGNGRNDVWIVDSRIYGNDLNVFLRLAASVMGQAAGERRRVSKHLRPSPDHICDGITDRNTSHGQRLGCESAARPRGGGPGYSTEARAGIWTRRAR